VLDHLLSRPSERFKRISL